MSSIYLSFFLSDLIVDGYGDNDDYESNNNVDNDNAKKDEIAPTYRMWRKRSQVGMKES
jgi:hypothetical protein